VWLPASLRVRSVSSAGMRSWSAFDFLALALWSNVPGMPALQLLHHAMTSAAWQPLESRSNALCDDWQFHYAGSQARSSRMTPYPEAAVPSGDVNHGAAVAPVAHLLYEVQHAQHLWRFARAGTALIE